MTDGPITREDVSLIMVTLMRIDEKLSWIMAELGGDDDDEEEEDLS